MVFLNHFIPSYFLRLGKSFEVTDWLTWLPTAQDSGLLCSAKDHAHSLPLLSSVS